MPRGWTQRRREVESQGTPTDPAALADVETALAEAERQWRECENDAGRWHARAEALAQALDSVRAAVDVSVLAGIEGIAGSLVDYLEIEAGAEAAVAAALGEAMHAIVVEGDDAARQAVQRIASGDAQALLLVLDARDNAVTMGATLAPEGAKALAACVRAPLPGLQATLTRLLAGVVLADGDWRSALDLAIENPDLTVMTPSGDRFGGRGLWRLGGEQVSGITRGRAPGGGRPGRARGRRPHRGRGGRRRGAHRGRRGAPSGRGGLERAARARDACRARSTSVATS